MADNRLYGGDVVNPAMMGGASVQPKQQALSGYTGSGQSNLSVRADTSEYDPYYRLKKSTLNLLGKSFEMGIESEKDKAYVDGMSKAISGQAEDAIESNFLTRNYGRAGYRDTEGKLALIDYKATALQDLQKDPLLARLTPEGYQQYLAKKKEQVMQYIGNASMQTRGKLMEQLIAEDFSLVQKQAELYTASVFNDEINTAGKLLNLSIVDLNNSRGSGGAYSAASVGAGLNIQDIITNERLDYGSKQKLVSEYLNSLSNNGHSDLARQLTQGTAFNIDGTNTTLAEWLSFDTFTKVTDGQNKGDVAWRDDRLKQVRAGIFGMTEQAKEDLNFDYNTAISEIYGLIGKGGLPSSEGFKAIKELTKLQGSQQDSYDVLRWLMNGDKEKLRTSKVSEKDAVTQYLTTFKDKPAPEKMADLIGIANNGITEALDGIGTIAEPALVKLLNQGVEALSDQDFEVLNSFIGLYNNQYFQENPQYTFQEVLAGVKNPNASMFLEGALNRYVEQVPIGDSTTPESVKAQAWESALQEQRMFHLDNPYAKEGRDRLTKQVFKDIDNIKIDQYAPGNFFRMSPFGSDASKGIKPNKEFKTWLPFFELGQGGQEASSYTSQAFYEEVRSQVQLLTNKGVVGSPELIRKRAEREVSKNSLLLEGDNFSGAFIGMSEATVQDFLQGNPEFEGRGFDANTLATSAITALTDKAVETLQRPGIGDLKVVVRQARGGRISITSWDNSTGIQQSNVSYSLDEVVQEANRVAGDLALTRDSRVAEGFTMYVQSKLSETHQGIRNPGTSQKHYSDVPLQINGVLDPKWNGSTKLPSEEVIATRMSLVEYEGAKLQRYKDGNGYSIGVGIHTGNSNIFPSRIKSDSDTLTKEELQNTFISASTYAISLADKASKTAPEGLDMPKYRMLLTHLAYQQGRLNDSTTEAFIKAVKDRDFSTAQDLLEQTNAYKSAGVDRRNFYHDLLQSL